MDINSETGLIGRNFENKVIWINQCKVLILILKEF